MPYPTQPTLTVNVLSSTSFQAVIASGDVGSTNRLFYRPVGAVLDTTGPTLVGNGTMSAVTGLTLNGQYQTYVVADNGSSYSLPSWAFVSLAQTDLISTALHALFSGNGALVSTVSGGMWTGEIPETQSPPYIWLDLGSVDTMPLFKDLFEYGRITAHLFAVGAEACEAAAQQFKAVFDFATLTFQAASSIYLMPRRRRMVPEPARWKDGTLMFRYILPYDLLIQRPTS